MKKNKKLNLNAPFLPVLKNDVLEKLVKLFISEIPCKYHYLDQAMYLWIGFDSATPAPKDLHETIFQNKLFTCDGIAVRFDAETKEEVHKIKIKEWISRTYTTFEQSKWLKERGGLNKDKFEIECKQGYDTFIGYGNTLVHLGVQSDSPFFYSAPDQSQLIEWLRVNHGIWIYAKRKYVLINGEALDKFIPIIEFIPQVKVDITDLPSFDTPQDAYSAAFDHVFEHILTDVKI